MTFANTPSPVALVTGGARGIGLACGRWFLANGYRVALLDVDAATLAATDAALADPQRVFTVRADVSQPEEVAAVVVLRENATADEKTLRAFVGEHLTDFKVPRRIVIVDEIPKGPSGKVQRIGLAQRLGLAE